MMTRKACPRSDVSFCAFLFHCRVNGVAMIGVSTESVANHRNERPGRARKCAIAAVDKAQFAPKIDIGDFDEFHFAGADLVASKACADKRNAQARCHESLDHADAGKLHGNAELRAVWAEELVEQLPREPGLRNDQRLIRDFGRSHRLVLSQRTAGTHHQHQAVAKNRVCSEAGRFYGKRDDADVHGAIFHFLDYLSAEVAINANLHGWEPSVEFGEDIGQYVEAG